MSEIELSKDERKEIEDRIQSYLREEFSFDVSPFDAGFILDFFVREIGPYFYNRGLYDAQAMLETRLETVRDDILSLEKFSAPSSMRALNDGRRK